MRKICVQITYGAHGIDAHTRTTRAKIKVSDCLGYYFIYEVIQRYAAFSLSFFEANFICRAYIYCVIRRWWRALALLHQCKTIALSLILDTVPMQNTFNVLIHGHRDNNINSNNNNSNIYPIQVEVAEAIVIFSMTARTRTSTISTLTGPR